MGGEMQPQGHLQVVSSMVDHGLNPQSALDAPRWRVQPDGVMLEPEVGVDVADGLRQRGHRVSIAPNRLDFGRGQIIRRLDSGCTPGVRSRAPMGWWRRGEGAGTKEAGK